MRSRNEHLTPDEIVEHVFPSGDRPSETPAHLSDCAGCRDKVARLREAWLLDRGAVDGLVEALPETFWRSQREAILRSLQAEAAPAASPKGGLHPFPASMRSGRLLRHPALALGSLAAALALVAGISFTRLWAPEHAGPDPQAVQTPALSTAPATDKSDDELLLSIEQVLTEEPPFTSLIPDGTT